MTAQKGITVIELLIVVAIIGILANLALPVVHDALWNSRAAVVITDFKRFESAVVNYMTDHEGYPRNSSVGRPDTEFAPYMPASFRWIDPHPWLRAYVWENWENKAHGRRLDIAYGFSLKEADDELLQAIQRVYDGRFEKTVYDKWTFVMESHPDSR